MRTERMSVVLLQPNDKILIKGKVMTVYGFKPKDGDRIRFTCYETGKDQVYRIAHHLKVQRVLDGAEAFFASLCK